MNFLGAFMVLLLLVLPGTGRAGTGGPSAGELFREIEERFDRVASLSYKVKRIAGTKTSTSEEQWTFRYRKPDLVRVDYTSPLDRVIIVGNGVLWEYIPKARKAARTMLSALPQEKRERTVSQVLTHVNVDGLRLGRYAEMEKKAVSVKAVAIGGAQAYMVEGADPRYVVHIDRDRGVLLRSEVFDDRGSLVMRTEASRFVEVGPRFWMPREIRATYATQAGFLQSTVLLSEHKVDAAIPDSIYQFTVPQGVELVNY